MASSPAAQRRSFSASDEPHPTTPLSARALPFPSRRSRPVVAGIRPQVDGGRRPAKACVGDLLAVEADAFVDGHEALWCELRWLAKRTRRAVHRTHERYDDRWRVLPIAIGATGVYRFMVRARVDRFTCVATKRPGRSPARIPRVRPGGAELVEVVRRARPGAPPPGGAVDRAVIRAAWPGGRGARRTGAVGGWGHPGRRHLLGPPGPPDSAFGDPGRLHELETFINISLSAPRSPRACYDVPGRPLTGIAGMPADRHDRLVGDGLYARLHPPHRPNRAQGTRRLGPGRPRRPGQPLGHRRRRGGSHRHPSRPRHAR